MFQIKARIDYGLMIMFELGKNEGQIMPLSVIAKRMEVSSVYLSQISNRLIKAGLIKSKEGVGGGYFLSRPASDISILEIVEALEGKIRIRCHDKDNENCPNLSKCEMKSIWGGILFDLKKVLHGRTLASILK